MIIKRVGPLAGLLARDRYKPAFLQAGEGLGRGDLGQAGTLADL